MRIYLTGFMGAGKTSVGDTLGRLLGIPFVDLDREIETREGRPVREIFAARGEITFRDLEHEHLLATARHQDVVVATGGGAVTFDRNLEAMRQLGVSVWLDPSFTTIVERMSRRGRASRPLFKSEDQAFELYRQRLAAYREADLRIDVAPDETPTQVAQRIVLELRERRCVI